MSTGGLYQLITNTGAQDRIIMATELLNKRLKEIKRIRCKNPAIKDKTPTLVDIERTHILFMNAHFKPFVAIGYEYQSIDVNEGTARLGGRITFSIPQFGDFFHDMVLQLRLNNLTPGVGATQARYCEFLGHRLLKRTEFEVNGNVLDYYDSDLYNFHYNFYITPNKRNSWLNCVGQEYPKPGSLTNNPGVDNYREAKFFLDGPQTPKTSHPSVEVWMPLLFWFNKDSRLMIPSVSIPYGQRFIRFILATANEICEASPANNFNAPVVSVARLWINNIFVNPEIHDIFIKRIGFQMIRVHRYQITPLTSNFDQIKLDQLKWPVETLYLGAKPDINLGTMEDWWRFSDVTNNLVPCPVVIPFAPPPPLYAVAVGFAKYKNMEPIINTFRLETHGIQLYTTNTFRFFNYYIPYNYGSEMITSPSDPGVAMVTFNLFPGSYQPSGHINLSVTREFYFIYQSAYLSVINTATLVVYAICINFLLVAEGTAALRYNV